MLATHHYITAAVSQSLEDRALPKQQSQRVKSLENPSLLTVMCRAQELLSNIDYILLDAFKSNILKNTLPFSPISPLCLSHILNINRLY